MIHRERYEGREGEMKERWKEGMYRKKEKGRTERIIEKEGRGIKEGRKDGVSKGSQTPSPLSP